MSENVTLRDNQAAAFEAAFRRVQHARMAGLPFLNLALAVEAVGFAPWKAHWLGALVTPWFMNLVIAPREAAAWRSLPPGEKRRYRFPAGDYDFVSAHEEGVGDYFCCSLFSPVGEFADQATARFVAQHALAALLAPPAEEAPPAGAPVERARPLSRRDLLRGRLAPDNDACGG